MFTPPGYRKRLLSDVERWTGAGLINRAAADAIAEEYRTDSSNAIVTVLAFLFAILLSLVANTSRVEPLGSNVVKTVTFFLSFVFVFYIIWQAGFAAATVATLPPLEKA